MALDKVIDSAELDANLTAVADAIRTKGGTTGELEFPSGFVSAVEGIQAGGGGDDSTLLSILDRSITEISSNEVLTVGDYAFYKCVNLVGVNFPNLKTIGESAFYQCKALEEIQLPSLTTIAGTQAFRGCSSLKKIHLPEVTQLHKNYTFRDCSSMTEFRGDKVTNFYDGTFENCGKLTEVYAPLANTLNTSTFRSCTALQKVQFPSCTKIDKSVFSYCSNLKEIVLSANTVASLGNVSAFEGSPFASGGTGGTVYVPSALIESYQTATNWSTLYAAGTCNFVAIEGSEYE